MAATNQKKQIEKGREHDIEALCLFLMLFFDNCHAVYLFEHVFGCSVAIVFGGDVSKALHLLFDVLVEPIYRSSANRSRRNVTVRIVRTAHHSAIEPYVTVAHTIGDENAVADELEGYGVSQAIVVSFVDSSLQASSEVATIDLSLGYQCAKRA